MKVYEIPDGEKQSKGRAIQNLVQIPQDDNVKAIISVKSLEDKAFNENNFIILCTRKGIIKKTKLEGFSRPRQNGINAINIMEGDELLEACMTDGSNQIMMALKSGRAIRFPEEKVRPTGRGATGVNGITVDGENDEVIGMICVNKEENGKTVLVVSEKGYGKRTSAEAYRVTNRGGKGVKTINITEKTGKLVGILDVAENEDLIITCKSGITLRTSVSSIKESGRVAQGVILIKLDAGDEIAAISKVNEPEETESQQEENSQANEVETENENNKKNTESGDADSTEIDLPSI